MIEAGGSAGGWTLAEPLSHPCTGFVLQTPREKGVDERGAGGFPLNSLSHRFVLQKPRTLV
jgi:hypothetical protein